MRAPDRAAEVATSGSGGIFDGNSVIVLDGVPAVIRQRLAAVRVITLADRLALGAAAVPDRTTLKDWMTAGCRIGEASP
jgi:hypothetical protein